MPAKKATTDDRYWDGYLDALKDVKKGYRTGVIGHVQNLEKEARKNSSGSSSSSTDSDSSGE